MSAYVWSIIAGLAMAATLLVFEGAAQSATAPPIVEAAEAVQTTRGWEADVLAGIGNAQPSAAAVQFLDAWHRAEGGNASFNWLNTTEDALGATDYNSVGVRNYPDYQAGIDATVRTLENGFYPNTLRGLQTNAPVVDDAEMGIWGTGGGNLRARLGEMR